MPFCLCRMAVAQTIILWPRKPLHSQEVLPNALQFYGRKKSPGVNLLSLLSAHRLLMLVFFKVQHSSSACFLPLTRSYAQMALGATKKLYITTLALSDSFLKHFTLCIFIVFFLILYFPLNKQCKETKIKQFCNLTQQGKHLISICPDQTDLC